MKKILTIALLSAVTICAAVFTYLRFRYPHFEKKQTALYEAHYEKNYTRYAKYFSIESLSVDGMTLILSDMLEKDASLALAFCVDDFDNLITHKYNNTIGNDEFYKKLSDSILKDKSNDNKLYYILNQKFYVTKSVTDKCNLVLVYPFQLSSGITATLYTEGAIASALAVTLVLSAFAFFTRKQTIPVIKTKEDKELESETVSLNADDLSNVEERSYDEEKRIEELLEPYATDEHIIRIENRRTAEKKIQNFESYIFNLFYKITIQFHIKSLALYLYDDNANSLKKIYELFGTAFVKTPPQNSLEIEDNVQILKALFEDSVIVRNNSMKIMIPLFSENDFIGMLVVKNDTPVTGSSYNAIRRKAADIGNYLMQEVHKKAV
jgi:hypothetical protein